MWIIALSFVAPVVAGLLFLDKHPNSHSNLITTIQLITSIIALVVGFFIFKDPSIINNYLYTTNVTIVQMHQITAGLGYLQMVALIVMIYQVWRNTKALKVTK